MTMEVPGSSDQQVGRDSFSRDIHVNSRNVGNICIQTGEEFSDDFLRDRARRAHVANNNVENDHNRQLVYEDLNRILGLQRVDSDVSDVLHLRGYTAEADSQLNRDSSVARYMENGVSDVQRTGKFTVRNYYNGAAHRPNAVPFDVADSPQMYQKASSDVSLPGKLKFLCSFGGRILTRPGDVKFRYIGGETRIISIRKNVSLNELMQKTYAVCNYPHTIKYQLPGEDLDSLISVCSDEDLLHMIEEYQEADKRAGSQKIRIFLVSSAEPDSPNSFNGRSTNTNTNLQQIGFDNYQCVSALNGVVDVSSRESSRGQSMSSQTTQFGNASDYSPTFHRDSPTSDHTLETRDCSPTTSSFLTAFANPGAVHFMSAMKVPRNSSGQQSPPSSPFPVHQRANTDIPYFVDTNGFFDNNLSYMVAPNFLPQHQFLLGTKQMQKHSEINFHYRSPSGDPHPQAGEAYMGSEKLMLKKNALSDPQLHDESLRLEPITRKRWKIVREQLPSLAMSNSAVKWQEGGPSFKNSDHRSKDKVGISTKAPKWIDHDDPGSFDQVLKQHESSSNCNPKSSNFRPVARVTSCNSQDSGSSVFTLSVNANEISVDALREKLIDVQLDTASDIYIRSQNSAGDLLCDTIKPSGQADYLASTKNLPDESERQQPTVPRCDLEISDDLSTRASLPREKVFHYCEMPLGKVGSRDAVFLHTQNSDDFRTSKLLGPPLNKKESDTLLEEATILPHVQSESGDNNFYSREEEENGAGHESEMEEKDANESIGEATMVEIEAGIYGLQIIKNSDLEDLHELGSGTFGTVYYGKWRGTDVAIKRIKNSCFSGRSSEQERQTKDFWREARILANLHHPNVVAFYGVVPDGPGGTMATVTEYMVNGSLRHALQRKDRSLDKRKKLMIALDAAFGMEYLHMKNIVHFDLKCDNLLVNLRDTQRPICKVGDFGLSRIKRNTLVSGGVRGTLPWMAPELLNGSSNRVSEKVDVFSFGIAMWEILTGEEPYANMHCGTIIGGILNNTLRPPVPEKCDEEWRKLMEQCWSFDPSERPPFTEIVDRLRSMSVALQPKRRIPAVR
ncbi:PREDICTED: serine/threonine-protein kinase phg2-like isoform X2 [Tarenaya hassleriana]|uniref:serine/threonine-protein kinase phg2-like isoform X2 n=1 Tax=Tarenaya hassleriana TaxID=28532 RepID=UPI00053C8DB0|nr:PREDICTED: serine/threonine-protein kinase phg2-like isoform X2 [Tarenaya hassleriana]